MKQAKTILIVLICVIGAMVAGLVVYANVRPNTDDTPDTYTVTFLSDNAVYKEITVNDGETVVLPVAPTKTGYTFDGWFYLDDETTAFDGSVKVTADITVTAKWVLNFPDDAVIKVVINLNTDTAFQNGSFGYDGNAHALTASAISNVTIEYSLNNSLTNAGTETVMITLTAGDGYTFEISDGVYESTIVINRTLTVTARAVTVTIGDASKAQDANIVTADGIGYTVTSGSIVGGDDLGITLSIIDADSAIGIYTITGDWSNTNYSVTFINGSYEVYFDGLLFTEVSGGYKVSVGTLAGATEIVIPTTYDGKPVVEIDNSFSVCTSLVKLTVPFVGNKLNGESNTHFGYIFGASSYSNNSTSVPASLKEVIVTGGTSIGDQAFYGLSGLTAVALTTIESIGSMAFYNCIGLTSITLPNITSIEYYAFSNCSGLTEITFPNITSIGTRAFGGCSGLTAFNVDDDNLYYSSSDGVLYNKDKTTLILYPQGKTGAFTSPDSVTSIGNHAFESCVGLTSVTLPYVTSIEFAVFALCSLTSISFPALISIEEEALAGCTLLTEITLPATLVNIELGAFIGSGLTEFIVDSGNPYYSELDGVLYNKDQTELIAYPSGRTGVFVVPNSVTTIAVGAFFWCFGLTEITIPITVTAIGALAFYEWTEDQTIHIEGWTESWTAPEAWGFGESGWDFECYAVIDGEV
ncbi:MAG: leucine-rich repeat protein [Clostridiales bacterium]|jgi:uncharacterized repeat protein (TIGR02543 family)|nr:leucine-rich repeat protein [Clostridiales bacterium]